MATSIVEVQTFCPSSGNIEFLRLAVNHIQGTVVSGEVKGCGNSRCPKANGKKCLIDQGITTGRF